MRKHPKHRNHANPNHHIRPLTPDRLERILYGESLPDKHSKERLQQAQKENAMPDMKTAMENALKTTLNEWADDDKPQTQPKEKAMPNPKPTINFVKTTDNKVRFVPTVGVSEATFNYVRDNPGKTRTEVIKALVTQGFRDSSVSSLFGQYLRMDYFTRDANDRTYAAFAEYKPLPSTKTQIRYAQAKKTALNKRAPKTLTLVTKKPKAEKPETAGIAALKVDTAVVDKFDIENMPIKQARALYEELRKIFGG